MGFFGSGNLRAEVEELLREYEEQKRAFESQNQDNIKQLNQKIERIALRMDDIEKEISQLKLQLTASQSEIASDLVAQQLTDTSSAPTSTTTSSASGDVVKLIYTGFTLGVFTVPLRLGVGDAWLKNAKANFILECEKGQTEGTFYPNPANLKVLAFNSQSNLSPVCDIVPGPSGTIVKPGIVSLDRSTNGWKVTQKCQIAL